MSNTSKAGDEGNADDPQTAENTCRRCGGTGMVDESPCPECTGTGLVEEIVGDA